MKSLLKYRHRDGTPSLLDLTALSVYLQHSSCWFISVYVGVSLLKGRAHILSCVAAVRAWGEEPAVTSRVFIYG